jgi:hypothetical protein
MKHTNLFFYCFFLFPILKKEKEELEATNQPDEDGFITVTQKNRKANLRFTERNIEKIKNKQKKKRQQMVNQILCFFLSNKPIFILIYFSFFKATGQFL